MLILINPPRSAITVVIGAAVVATALAVGIMVIRGVERGRGVICESCRVAGHQSTDCQDAGKDRASCCCQHRPITADQPEVEAGKDPAGH